MNVKPSLIVNVKMERIGEMYSASSDDIPGLHISGYTLESTGESVINAIKALFKHGKDMAVQVTPATSDFEDFKSGSKKYTQFIVHRVHA